MIYKNFYEIHINSSQMPMGGMQSSDNSGGNAITASQVSGQFAASAGAFRPPNSGTSLLGMQGIGQMGQAQFGTMPLENSVGGDKVLLVNNSHAIGLSTGQQQQLAIGSIGGGGTSLGCGQSPMMATSGEDGQIGEIPRGNKAKKSVNSIGQHLQERWGGIGSLNFYL